MKKIFAVSMFFVKSTTINHGSYSSTNTADRLILDEIKADTREEAMGNAYVSIAQGKYNEFDLRYFACIEITLPDQSIEATETLIPEVTLKDEL